MKKENRWGEIREEGCRELVQDGQKNRQKSRNLSLLEFAPGKGGKFSNFRISKGAWSHVLEQQSPVILAPGTGLMEDSSSTNSGAWDGFRMIQAH